MNGDNNNENRGEEKDFPRVGEEEQQTVVPEEENEQATWMKQNSTEEEKAVEPEMEESAAESAQEESFIPGVHILAEEEGLLVEKDGRLELEQEVKEKIIKAFKQTSDEEEETSSTAPRIFGKKEEEGPGAKEAAEEEKKTKAAVRIIEEERKSRTDKIKSTREEERTRDVREELLSKIKKERTTVANCEVLVVRDTDYAMGLSYSPGMIPRVLVKGKKKKALKLIRDAFKIEVPVVEIADLDVRNFEKIEVGKEIPGRFYPAAARALALIYRLKPDAHMVRFLKPERNKTRTRKKRARKLVDKYRDILKISPLVVEVPEETYNYREQLLEQLELTTNQLVAEMGLIIPQAEVRKSTDLLPEEYLFKIKEITYDVGHLDATLEPPEIFYPLQSRFRGLIYTYGYELLGYTETEALINRVKKGTPGLVKALFPRNFNVGALRFVLRGLLREQIPIKDLVTILETIEAHVHRTNDPELLIEYIRAAFSQYISTAYRDGEGSLNVLLLSDETEQKILGSIKEKMNIRWLDMEYSEGLRFLSALDREMKKVKSLGIPVAILTTPSIRRFIRKITEAIFPHLPVLAYSEIAPFTPVKTVGIIDVKKA